MYHNTSRSWLALLCALAGLMIGGLDRSFAQDVPRLAGDYVTVYRPAGDRFPGPDTRELKYWFVSSVEWPQRGVSIAPLTWAKPLDIP